MDVCISVYQWAPENSFFWFSWKTCISDRSVVLGIWFWLHQTLQKTFSYFIGTTIYVKISQIQRYWNQVPTVSLSFWRTELMPLLREWSCIEALAVSKSKTIHWVSTGPVSKLCEMMYLIGFTSEAIIAPNCAQGIRDLLGDSWPRRSLLQ